MEIQHNKNNGGGIFFIEETGKQVAELEYIIRNENVLHIMHTGVKPEMEGKGIGKKLVDEAVSYARENDFNVKPLCKFAAKEMLHSDKYKDILAS